MLHKVDSRADVLVALIMIHPPRCSLGAASFFALAGLIVVILHRVLGHVHAVPEELLRKSFV